MWLSISRQATFCCFHKTISVVLVKIGSTSCHLQFVQCLGWNCYRTSWNPNSPLLAKEQHSYLIVCVGWSPWGTQTVGTSNQSWEMFLQSVANGPPLSGPVWIPVSWGPSHTPYYNQRPSLHLMAQPQLGTSSHQVLLLYDKTGSRALTTR